VKLPDGDGSPPDEISIALFRIFQEALTNVARHAHASRVEVELTEEEGTVVLRVSDDGRGIRPAELDASRSLGLLGMRERAGQLGGEVSFPRAEQGTQVVARIPLPGPD
jgi:signal transduction histidine kinase